jgi:flagella basal body P-ring formation protein FlgA
MKRISICFVLGALLAGGAAAETVLLLRSAVKVSSVEVTLGDLVIDSAQIPSEWAKRRVMDSPAAGEVSYHALTAVAYALQQYTDMGRIVLRGEPVISVQRKDRRIETSELEAPILTHLQKTDPWKGLDLSIKVLSIPENTRIPEGVTTYRITQIDQKTAKGYSMAHVVVLVDDLEAKEIPVGIEIQSLTAVWVLRKNMSPGQILTKEDLRSEQQVVDATSQFVPSTENLEGFEVTHSLAAGSLLRRNAVSKPLCVKRGEWVSINAFGAGLHVTLRGKALANGRLGERVMCVNERSQRQVLVELVGAGMGVLVRM